MKWSWRIATYSGIPVYIHATFLLLIGFVLWVHFEQGHNLATALGGVAFILLLFLCVILHEFGHALTAKRYGIKTRDITLLPIGGVARLERMPDDPRQELWVALAGPAVNVVIAVGLYVVLSLTSGLGDLSRTQLVGGGLLPKLMLVNVWLVVFNMLPAFPMDGGRVLRALLAMRMPYAQATQIAAGLGQGMAFIFGFIGLWIGHPFLIFIALFVYLGAAGEASAAVMRASFENVPVREAMVTHFQALDANSPLQAAVDALLAGYQQDFPVLENGAVVGVLTRQDLVNALAAGGPSQPVANAMRRTCDALDAEQMLDVGFQRIQASECHSLPVLSRGQLVGMITAENIGEFVMVRTALTERARRSR